MKVIVRERQSGKTTDLIKRASEDWLYIVCPTRQMAQHTFDLARKMELDIPFPITFDEFARGGVHRPGIRGFLFDDLDTLLHHLAGGVPVIAVTITETEEAPDNLREKPWRPPGDDAYKQRVLKTLAGIKLESDGDS